MGDEHYTSRPWAGWAVAVLAAIVGAGVGSYGSYFGSADLAERLLYEEARRQLYADILWLIERGEGPHELLDEEEQRVARRAVAQADVYAPAPIVRYLHMCLDEVGKTLDEQQEDARHGGVSMAECEWSLRQLIVLEVTGDGGAGSWNRIARRRRYDDHDSD